MRRSGGRKNTRRRRFAPQSTRGLGNTSDGSGARCAGAVAGRGRSGARRRGLGDQPVIGWPALRVAAELPSSADVVIVGGGIVGAATAFFARRAGLRVVLLEKRAALCTLTTPVSTGAFRLQFDNPEEVALVREGIELFDQFAEVAELPGYDLRIRKQGYLFCASTAEGAEHQRHFVAALHGWGVSDVELLRGDEARYRFPYLSPNIIQSRFRGGD